MSNASRKFRVPDALAHIYDLANALDLRSFVQHGVKHTTRDELGSSKDLASWLARRGLLEDGGKLSQDTYDSTLRLRARIRDYLQRDPAVRHFDADTVRELNQALQQFPLVVEVSNRQSKMTMHGIWRDGSARIVAIVEQFYDGAANGTLDRLKMCASEECRRVFYDRSKPGTRRWCQAALCGNRIKTRAYRERHKA